MSTSTSLLKLTHGFKLSKTPSTTKFMEKKKRINKRNTTITIHTIITINSKKRNLK